MIPGNRKSVLLWAFAALLFMFIGGCTGGNPPGTPGKTSPTPASTSSGETPGNAILKDQVLKIGRIPFTNATEMYVKHEALMKYLQTELGIKGARLVLANDYEGIITKIGNNEIDIAWLGSFPYVEGSEKHKLKPLVKPVRFGTTSYRGIIITRQDSGIKRLSDLRGKKFAWVEKESASGYIFPKALLMEAGVDTDKDFSEFNYLNKHDAVVLNVFLGKYDAGACYDDARNTLKDKEKVNQLTILATTQDIANEPIVCRQDFPEDLAERVKQAFLKLSIKDPLYKKVLDDCTDVQGFVPAKDSDYDYIRKMSVILKNQKPR